ncbi:hypothetical protein ACHAXM_006483 [Skeletonema potamos]
MTSQLIIHLPPPPANKSVGEDIEINSTPVLERLHKGEAALLPSSDSNTSDEEATKNKNKYYMPIRCVILSLLLLIVGGSVGTALGILLPREEEGSKEDGQVEELRSIMFDMMSPSSIPSQVPSTFNTPTPTLRPSTKPTTTPSMLPTTTETKILTFFAIGDVPYSDMEACLLPHELDKAAASGTDAKFMLHLGDIRDGKPFPDTGLPRPCPEYLYEDVATIFERSSVSVFFSLGDNEWLDCANVDESYTFLKRHLLTFNDRKDLRWPELGATVSRNEDHIEMYSFVLKDVLIIGQGLPGEGWSTDHAWTQWNVYLDENVKWLEKSFAENNFKAVVICGNSSKGWNERYFLGLEKVAKTYADIPILFLGDEHDFQEEVEFRGIPNLHWIALDDVVTPTLIMVDPYAAGGTSNIFTYDRRCPCAGNHRPTELFNYTSGVCAGVCETNNLCINEEAESVLWGE